MVASGNIYSGRTQDFSGAEAEFNEKSGARRANFWVHFRGRGGISNSTKVKGACSQYIQEVYVTTYICALLTFRKNLTTVAYKGVAYKNNRVLKYQTQKRTLKSIK